MLSPAAGGIKVLQNRDICRRRRPETGLGGAGCLAGARRAARANPPVQHGHRGV